MEYAPFPNRTNFIDRNGQTIGQLEVLGYLGSSKWHCKCSCGNYTEKRFTSDVKRASCDECTRKMKQSMMAHAISQRTGDVDRRKLNYEGKIVGTWLVKEYDSYSVGYMCECTKCGFRRAQQAPTLKKGGVKCIGCKPRAIKKEPEFEQPEYAHTWDEISEELGIPKTTVCHIYNKAMKKIHDMIRDDEERAEVLREYLGSVEAAVMDEVFRH